MKLYVSGPIATEPDFLELFKKDCEYLELVGFEVVNPTKVRACRDDSDQYVKPADCLSTQGAIPAGLHSWQCYMKYDLIEMLACDAVAVQDGHLNSSGAILEIYLAKQVGMQIKTVKQWHKIGLMRHMHRVRLEPSNTPTWDELYGANPDFTAGES